MRALILILTLAGCVAPTTKEGCPIYTSEVMQPYTQACIQAFYEERAKQTGGQITRCFGAAGQTTCVTE